MNNKLPISNFMIKIVALVTMTMDHIGYILSYYSILTNLSEIFRIIGRIAFPLFCFMIVEGVLHTKSIKKYLFRLGICALLIAVGFVIVEYLPLFNGFSIKDEGNIFSTLFFGALTIYLLNHPKWYIKLLSLLPIAFFVLSSIIIEYEFYHHIDIWLIPFFIRPQYELYGLFLMLMFYLGKKIGSLLKIKNQTINQLLNNSIVLIMLVLVSLLANANVIPGLHATILVKYRLLYLLINLPILFIFIILYNGNRGYNAPWFKYGCYLYYPLHLILIYGIFWLVG